MAKSVYELLKLKKGEVNFWIKRYIWSATCAQIIKADPLQGVPPYYDNPRVWIDVYNFRTGQLIKSNLRLMSPGTYNYKEIAPPKWVSLKNHHLG